MFQFVVFYSKVTDEEEMKIEKQYFFANFNKKYLAVSKKCLIFANVKQWDSSEFR